MTVTMVQLAESLQALVDARLDTIDRMLVGRVPRGDRLAIVGEVETQIVDMLQGSDAEELTRDDVLAILGRLDPPEAFLPVPGDGEQEGIGHRPIGWPGPVSSRPSSPSGNERVALTSGILGLSSLAMFALVPLIILAAETFQSESFIIFGELGLAGWTFVGGVLSATLGIYARRGGVWALVGIVTGVFAVLISLLLGVFTLLNLV